MFSEQDDVTDVLIIGSGFAGLTAAIEAHNAGATVVILEKMHAPGGNSIISDGGIAAAGTKMQKTIGIEDSFELMFEDMLKAGLYLNHPELVRELVKQSNEVFQWSIDYLGIEYMDRVDIFGGHSVPRCYTPIGVSGSTIIRKQLLKMKELGLSVRTHSLFKSFIRSPEGEIVGVSVSENYNYKNPECGIESRIRVKKGVVLASGGFSSDVQFRSKQDPRLNEKIDTTNKPFATAEALKEALRINANPIHLSHIQLGPWGTPDEKGYGHGARFSDYIVFPYGMVIDPSTSNRIVNELADRKTISDAILSIGRPCIGIVDERAVEQSGWDIVPCLEKGITNRFSRLEDLAKFYNLSLNDLSNTIDRYNNYVENRFDGEYSKPILPEAYPISSPPYYGIRTWPKVHHTMGGVQINPKAQVIDIYQDPIKGLFAAGEVVGGIHGACRLGSCAITDCLVFGRIAGRNAAIEVLNEK
ncbi:flavocytochrome c [Chloroflexota bacterium]